MKYEVYKKVVVATIMTVVIYLIPNTSYLIPVAAQTTSTSTASTGLQAKIDQRNSDIANLDAQIKGYQTQINSLGTQATSLSATIKAMDLNRKQLEAKIAVTQDQISEKSYEIQRFGTQIGTKQSDIEDDQRIIKQTFLTLEQQGDRSLPEVLLGSDSISQALTALDSLGILQKSVYDRIGSLNTDKSTLETNMTASQKAKSDLLALNKQLADQRAIVLSTAAEQNQLLKQTSQSQASYRQLLATKQAEEAAMQEEINQYELQLHLSVNASQIPHTGSGVLTWPLDNTYPNSCPPPSGSFLSCITQYFGNTPFATANPQIYGGIGHDGVDFRASIGTPVKAALSGVIVGVENTDSYPGCYSFGKWIMIKHDDGLSTLYAHLSLQSVSVGQQVTTGQLIGYSGNTGYTTGPHLHFGVYATAGTVIKLFTQSKHCQGATIPVADFSAYLNPLSYL
jgi:murein DD-endopeptidase MepM/ murein hydrolase activator NlpD